MISAAQLAYMKQRSAEQKRRIAAGEILVCSAVNVLPFERSEDGKCIFHENAKPMPPFSQTRRYKCPHCSTEIPITRKRWDETLGHYVPVADDAR